MHRLATPRAAALCALLLTCAPLTVSAQGATTDAPAAQLVAPDAAVATPPQPDAATATPPSRRDAATARATRLKVAAPKPASYGGILLRMILGLGAVCAIAFIALKWGLQRALMGKRGDHPIRVLARLPVEPRRSMMIIQVASRTLVIGASEAGMELVAELHGEDARAFEPQAPSAKRAAPLVTPPEGA